MITLKEYTMDIKTTIDNLNARYSELEKEIAADKEEMKSIRLKVRKLETICKHAESVLTDEETVKQHEESEA